MYRVYELLLLVILLAIAVGIAVKVVSAKAGDKSTTKKE